MPPPLCRARTDLPSPLERLVDRCLEKDPAPAGSPLRRARGGSLAVALGVWVVRRISSAPGPGSRLAGLASLGVISRESSKLASQSEDEPRRIGERLGADFVLAGRVRWEGGAEAGVSVEPLASAAFSTSSAFTPLGRDTGDDGGRQIDRIRWVRYGRPQNPSVW